ncbi:MAG: hypothetical protein AABZ60_21240 [Planctomycetota bacterium]
MKNYFAFKICFSLLEILIALAVLMIGMTSLLTLFGVAASQHQKSVMDTKCALLISNILEEIQKDLTSKSLLSSRNFIVSETYPDIQYYLKLQALYARQELYSVEIYIRWKAGGKWIGEAFHTLLRRQIY